MTPAEMKARADELEDLAYKGREMPQELSTADQLLFLKFRLLYQYARAGSITPAQGKREKQAILLSYTVDQLNDELFKRASQMWKNTENALCAVRKDQTLMQNPKVRALVSAIDGINRKEETT